jgi:hypothetical protein
MPEAPPTVKRRAFLKTLAAAVAGATLDPEKLLWIPGQKKIFLPAATQFGRPLTIDMLQKAMQQIAARGGNVHTYMAAPTIIRRYQEMIDGDVFAGVDEDKRLPDGSLVLGGRIEPAPAITFTNREIAKMFAEGRQADEIRLTLDRVDRSTESIFHVGGVRAPDRAAVVISRPSTLS